MKQTKFTELCRTLSKTYFATHKSALLKLYFNACRLLEKTISFCISRILWASLSPPPPTHLARGVGPRVVNIDALLHAYDAAHMNLFPHQCSPVTWFQLRLRCHRPRCQHVKASSYIAPYPVLRTIQCFTLYFSDRSVHSDTISASLFFFLIVLLRQFERRRNRFSRKQR